MQGLGDHKCWTSIADLGTLLLQTIAPVYLSKMAMGADGSKSAPLERESLYNFNETEYV